MDHSAVDFLFYTAVDHSAVDFLYCPVVVVIDHSAVDHSAVDFQLYSAVDHSAVGFSLPVGMGELWVNPHLFVLLSYTGVGHTAVD